MSAAIGGKGIVPYYPSFTRIGFDSGSRNDEKRSPVYMEHHFQETTKKNRDLGTSGTRAVLEGTAALLAVTQDAVMLPGDAALLQPR